MCPIEGITTRNASTAAVTKKLVQQLVSPSLALVGSVQKLRVFSYGSIHLAEAKAAIS
jgi:hypothetical protein